MGPRKPNSRKRDLGKVTYQINVWTLQGRVIHLMVEGTCTLRDVKALILEKEPCYCSPDQFQLVFKKKLLANCSCTLQDRDIQAESRLYLLLRGPGGPPHEPLVSWMIEKGIISVDSQRDTHPISKLRDVDPPSTCTEPLRINFSPSIVFAAMSAAKKRDDDIDNSSEKDDDDIDNSSDDDSSQKDDDDIDNNSDDDSSEKDDDDIDKSSENDDRCRLEDLEWNELSAFCAKLLYDVDPECCPNFRGPKQYTIHLYEATIMQGTQSNVQHYGPEASICRRCPDFTPPPEPIAKFETGIPLPVRRAPYTAEDPPCAESDIFTDIFMLKNVENEQKWVFPGHTLEVLPPSGQWKHGTPYFIRFGDWEQDWQGRPSMVGWIMSPLPLEQETQDTACVPYSMLERCTQGWSSQKLGEGGFGCVFLGTHPSNTRLAIKRLDQSDELAALAGITSVDQFNAEVTMLRSYQHPSLIQLLFYSSDLIPCLVYPYMPNGSLEDRLQQKNGSPPLSQLQRVSALCEVVQGLAYLHTEAKITHRDIKSANILLDGRFSAKISGLACLFIQPKPL